MSVNELGVNIKTLIYANIVVGDVNDIITFIKAYVDSHGGSTTTEYVRKIDETPTTGVYQYIQVDGTTETTKQLDIRAVHQFVGSKDSSEVKSTYFSYFTNDGLFVKLNNVEQQVVLLSYLQTNYPTISGVDSMVAVIENQINGITTNISNCVNDITLNSSNLGLLKITKVNGHSDNLNIAGNTRYRHFYTMKQSSAWSSPCISFFIDLPSNTPLSSDGLFNYLGTTPFWSTASTDYGIYPVTGTTAVSSGVATVAIGMFVYIEESGGIVNKTIRVLYNYNATTSFDATTLTCVGIQDRFTGSWINLSNTRKSNDNQYNSMEFGVNEFMIEQKIAQLTELKEVYRQQYRTAYDTYLSTKAETDKQEAEAINNLITSISNGIFLLKSGNIPTIKEETK